MPRMGMIYLLIVQGFQFGPNDGTNDLVFSNPDESAIFVYEPLTIDV